LLLEQQGSRRRDSPQKPQKKKHKGHKAVILSVFSEGLSGSVEGKCKYDKCQVIFKIYLYFQKRRWFNSLQIL
jgi:hypothetical protein